MLEKEGQHPKSHSPARSRGQVFLPLGQHRDRALRACVCHRPQKPMLASQACGSSGLRGLRVWQFDLVQGRVAVFSVKSLGFCALWREAGTGGH